MSEQEHQTHYAGSEQLANWATLTTENFDEIIAQHKMIVIDFWAEWCVPCRNFATTFVAIAKRYPNILFATVDIENENKLATDFAIRSIPYVMIIRESVVVFAESGVMPESALEDLLKQAMSLDMATIHEQAQKQMSQEE